MDITIALLIKEKYFLRCIHRSSSVSHYEQILVRLGSIAASQDLSKAAGDLVGKFYFTLINF